MPPQSQPPPTYRINYVYRPGGIGLLRPLIPGSVLHSGDHYKIIFTPDQEAYVYIFQVDSAGQIVQLFPMKAFKGVAVNNVNPVRAGKTYILPAARKAFKLDHQVGTERLYFLAFPDRHAELEALYREIQGARRRQQHQRAAEAQARLRRRFVQRGVQAIVTDRTTDVVWGEDGEVFMIWERRLEALCKDCVHRVEFLHQE